MTKAQQLTRKYRTLLNRYGINTPLRLAHFWGNCFHESRLELVRENMNYSAKRIIEVFKRRIDRNRDGFLSEQEKQKVREIAGNPVKIANFVYGNRMGNRGENTNDGWNFRAGGFMGLTFRNNYEALSRDTKIDFISNPDIISQEANAVLSAAWFWHTNNLNRWADRDDTDGVADVINIGRKTNTIGDANGYGGRIKHINYYKTIFKNEL